MGGVDLIKYIKYMLYTTLPSIIISLTIFLIIGFQFSGEIDKTEINLILNNISENFEISPFLFVTPIIMIFLIIKKVQPFPALLLVL